MLKSLCDLYALWNLSVEMKHLLQEGVLAAEHAAWVDQLIKDSLLPGTVHSHTTHDARHKRTRTAARAH